MKRIQRGAMSAFCATLIAASLPQHASAYSFVIDDAAQFNAALNANPASTITDSGGAFAADPAASTGNASVPRSGTDYDYVSYDVSYANQDVAGSPNVPPGALVFDGGGALLAGGDVRLLSTLDVETPAGQDGANGSASWGLDSSGVSTNSSNAALFDFSRTPGDAGVGHFALNLLDFESSAGFSLGQVRLYNDGLLIASQLIDWGGDDGDGVNHFFGIAAESPGEFFDQVMFVLGDDNDVGGSVGGRGYSERWAADNFTFGQAFNAAAPVAAPAGMLARLRRHLRRAGE